MIIRTTTYEDFAWYADAWAKGYIKNLFIMGYPGTSKTYTIMQALKSQPRTVVCTSHLTPKALYLKLQEWENSGITLVVLDDVQAAVENDTLVGILKGALDTGVVEWHSTQGDQPEQIKVNMRFCIITNAFGVSNEHVRAIQDRSFTIEYGVSPQDILTFAVKRGIIDQDMHNKISFIGWPSNGRLSLRDLAQLATLKRLGADWESKYKANLRQR